MAVKKGFEPRHLPALYAADRIYTAFRRCAEGLKRTEQALDLPYFCPNNSSLVLGTITLPTPIQAFASTIGGDCEYASKPFDLALGHLATH